MDGDMHRYHGMSGVLRWWRDASRSAEYSCCILSDIYSRVCKDYSCIKECSRWVLLLVFFSPIHLYCLLSNHAILQSNIFSSANFIHPSISHHTSLISPSTLLSTTCLPNMLSTMATQPLLSPSTCPRSPATNNHTLNIPSTMPTVASLLLHQRLLRV